MSRERPRRAMLLAAGRGERLRPHTDTRPKPLIEVAGRSLIDRQLDRLEEYGIERVVVNTHYLAGMIEDHLRARRSPEIVFSREAIVLETGGGVQQALPLLGDTPFFTLNSDVVLLDGASRALGNLAEAWEQGDGEACLLLQSVATARGYDGHGDFFFDDRGLVRRGEAASAPFLYAGAQIIDPRCFDGLPPGRYSLNRVWDRRRRNDGALPAIDAVVHDGAWLHVGDPAGLAAAETYLATRDRATINRRRD